MAVERRSTTDPRQRARPRPAADRDQRLLAAARVLFAEKGFEATTIAHVASRAGVAVGTVYLRHQTKTHLLAGVLEQVAMDFVAVMSEPAIHDRPWSERLRPLFAALIAEALRQPDLPALMTLTRHLPQQTGENIIRSWIADFVTQGQAAGAFRPMPTDPAAAIAFGMVQGGMDRAIHAPAEAEKIAAMLADAAERWVLAEYPPATTD